MPTVKVFCDIDHCVFDLLNSADENGRAHFVKPKSYLPAGVSLKSQAAIHEVLQSTLMDYALLAPTRIARLKALEPSKEVVPNGDWLVGFNVAKFFMLPCIKPAEELIELNTFFEALLPFFEGNKESEKPVALRVLNERDSNGRVYAGFRHIHGGQQAADWEENLRALIAASPTLLATTRNWALELGKIGRYSWSDWRESHLYIEQERPRKGAMFKRMMEKRIAENRTQPSA